MKRVTSAVAVLLGVLSILPIAASAQIQVSGRVTDAATGDPLPGVSVTVQGTTIGAQTDLEGNYKIEVPDEQAVLEFRFLGYAVQTAQASTSPVNIQLKSDTEALSEVVVTAYGIERQRSELPYASQQVNADDLTRTRDPNFVNSLTGKVAGVSIKQPNTMGGSTNIVMRGYSSLKGNNQALFVIDGMPVDNSITNTDGSEDADRNQLEGRGGYDYGNTAADINPDNIASINILRGAAATALYGSRAANGVVMITTKKGKKNSMNVTLNTGVTFGRIDKSTYTEYQKEYGAGYGAYYESPDGYFLYRDPFITGEDQLVVPFSEDASYGAAFDPNLMVYHFDAFDESSPNYGQLRPWVAAQNDPVSFFETSVNSSQNIAVAGGGENTTFRVAYTRNDEKGILPNSEISKNLFNFSGSYTISPKITINATANYSGIKALGRFGTGYDGRNPNQSFRQWWQVNADIKVLEEAYFRERRNITWNWTDPDVLSPIYTDNPYFDRYENYNNDNRDRFFGNISVNWKPADWLDITGRVSHDGYNELQEERIALTGAAIAEYMRFERSFGETNFDLLLNFKKDISQDISFTGLLGSNLRRNRLQSIRQATNGGLTIPDFYALSNSVGPLLPPIERYARVGVDGIFGNVRFGYKETVFLEGSLRTDQSTTLPPDNNRYWYPSIGANFIFSNTMDADWLSFGKLRLNYAEVGSDAPALSIYDVYEVIPPMGGPMASIPPAKNNPDLLPERTKSAEAGVELSFLEDRLGLDFSWYTSTTEDQIYNVSLSPTTGYNTQWVNAGSIRNRGIEVSLYTTPVRTEDFSWSLNLNFTRNRNKVLDLYGDNDNLQLGSFQGGITVNATLDEPFGTLRGQDYIYSENGEKVVGEDGYYLTTPDRVVIGDVNPDWLGGINNTFRYKDISLSFLIDIRKGGSVFSLDQYYGQATGIYPESVGPNDMGNPKRLPISEGGGVILPGVKEDGTPNDIRVEAYDYTVGPYGFVHNPQAGFVYDGSFVKLRELSITYSLPQSLVEKMRVVKGIDLSLIGRNLWILHKNVPYADPEAGLSAGNFSHGIQSGAYPSVRTFGFNLNCRF